MLTVVYCIWSVIGLGIMGCNIKINRSKDKQR